MTTAPLPKRVFITGAQGFIGQQLMRRYRDLGCDVRGMDLQGNPEQGIVAADLCQPKQWAHHVEGCELFIHTAAVVSLSASWADYRRITVDGVRYGPIEAALDSSSASNAWLTLGLKEGKNREVRKVLQSVGLTVNRLMRVAYGPFQLGSLKRGEISESKLD